MLAKGQGVGRDEAQAIAWFRKAADQGGAQAQFNLDLMYRDGNGVQKDDTQAAEWFRKAADQGDFKHQLDSITRNLIGSG